MALAYEQANRQWSTIHFNEERRFIAHHCVRFIQLAKLFHISPFFFSFLCCCCFFLRNIFNHRRTTIVDKEMFIKMTCQSTKIIFDERDYAKVSHKKRQYHAIVVQLYIANITCYFNKNLISRISVNKQLLESINRFFFKRLLNDRNKLSQSPIAWKLLSR